MRFTREVEAARAVSGFYTAAVVDADPRAAVPWLATAFVPAPSLEEMVNECGPMPVQAVRWLAAGIAEALQSIHGAGLVHRDLKPSNVLVVEDGPRVIDFGIASGVSNSHLTMTNVAVGTPAYMSPEQARDSRSVTGASDVFSLASTLVFAATGHAPFHGANPVETVFMLLRDGPDLDGLADELRPLIDSCMRTPAEERPTPADLQAQLAPHLFSSGGDDSGTASAWLPPGAVALIERKRATRMVGRGGSPARPARSRPRWRSAQRWPGPALAPPRPAHAPDPVQDAGPDLAAMPPAQAPAAVGSRRPAWGAGPPAVSAAGSWAHAADAAPAGGAAQDGAPVQLAGTQVPIGPGPAPTHPAPVRGRRDRDELGAAARRFGRRRRLPRPASHRGPAAPPPAVLSLPRRTGGCGRVAPARWRPWRFRMSNDVWGTPAVAGDLVYVTSFEVHALDVASGRRRFKTREVAWSMKVAGGRVTRLGRPGLYALDAVDGAERWRVSTDGWVYSLDVDRRHRRHRHPRRRGAGLGRGDRRGPVGPLRRAERLRDARGRPVSCMAAPSSLGPTAGCSPSTPAPARSAGTTMSATPPPSAASRCGSPSRPTAARYVCAGSRVLALDAASGAERWRFDAPAAFLSPAAFVPGPAVAGGGVYLADYLGTVYALDAANGRDRWRLATEARHSTEAVIAADGLHPPRQRQRALHPGRRQRHPEMAVRGGRRCRRLPGRHRRPGPLRLGRPLPLHPGRRRRSAALETGDRRGDHRIAAGRRRRRVRLQQGPLRVRPRRREGHRPVPPAVTPTVRPHRALGGRSAGRGAGGLGSQAACR